MTRIAPSATLPADTDPRHRLRTALESARDGTDPLPELIAGDLLVRPDGLPVQSVDVRALEDAVRALPRADGLAPVPGSIGRVDPRRSRVVLASGQTLGMYVADCYINTEAEPAYHRLPSFSDRSPYHIVYLIGFGANQKRTAMVNLQVFSAGGSVRITTTGNPAATVIGQSSLPITIPVPLTTTAQGFASVFVQRVGATGFDWFACDVV